MLISVLESNNMGLESVFFYLTIYMKSKLDFKKMSAVTSKLSIRSDRVNPNNGPTRLSKCSSSVKVKVLVPQRNGP